MTRLLSVITLSLMIATLVGCGETNKPSSNSNTENKTNTSETVSPNDK